MSKELYEEIRSFYAKGKLISMKKTNILSDRECCSEHAGRAYP